MDGAPHRQRESDDTPSCRLFRTGDARAPEADGLLERIGRKDRQVKIRGARVDLDGVEAIASPASLSCATWRAPGPNGQR